jgi:hypothetical protein
MRIFGRAVTILRPRPVETPEQREQRARQDREAEAARRRDDRERAAQRRATEARAAEQAAARAEAARREQAVEEWREMVERVGFWFPGDRLVRPERRGLAGWLDRLRDG